MPTKSVSMTFDEWIRIADEVEEKIYNNETAPDLYYMKMVGGGGTSSDVSGPDAAQQRLVAAQFQGVGGLL